MLDVDDVVYVDDVSDDDGIGAVSGTREFADGWTTAHTSNANSSSPATPAATITGCWSCQLPSSSPPPAGVLSPAGPHLPGPTRQCALEKWAEADAANSERRERRGVVLIGQRDHVDRQRQLGGQAPQCVRVVAAHRVQRIGACGRCLFQPRYRTVDTVGFLTIGPDEQIGA